MSKFPATLYVGVEEEGTEDEFLHTEKDIEDLAVRGGKEIAVYQLREVVVADLKLDVRPSKTRAGKK